MNKGVDVYISKGRLVKRRREKVQSIEKGISEKYTPKYQIT